jgi:tripartite-type tricarboxylate transporter receptor subunit TctC
VGATLFIVMASGVGSSIAQNFPHKPVRIVCSEAGSSVDITARLIAHSISPPLAQPVIVENRPARLLAEILLRALPDGYTIVLTGSTVWIDPLMRSDASWNALRDFAPVTLATSTPLVVVVHPSVGASSVKELIALAKARPGQLNYGSGASGSSSHLGPELFKSMAGIDIVRVPYKGAAPALNALVAGSVQLMIASAGSAMPHVRAGKLRALAVASTQPSALLPELPTVASTLPGFEAAATLAILAPSKTPAVAIERLNHEIVQALHRPDVRQALLNDGSEPVGNTPQELRTMMAGDIQRLGKVIKAAGIRAD